MEHKEVLQNTDGVKDQEEHGSGLCLMAVTVISGVEPLNFVIKMLTARIAELV
jgi:hypothetical protein